MRRAGVIAFALMLSGCTVEGRFLTPRETVIPAGDTVIEKPDGTEIIEPPKPLDVPMCQARARFFRGTVSIPCVEIGRATAP